MFYFTELRTQAVACGNSLSKISTRDEVGVGGMEGGGGREVGVQRPEWRKEFKGGQMG